MPKHITLEEYIPFVRGLESAGHFTITAAPDLLGGYNATRLIHAGLGLATEALELVEAMRSRNRDNQIREMGDISFFSAVACDAVGVVPTEEEVKRCPTLKVQRLIEQCETAASRIKAGLYYGDPAKPGDPPGYWKDLFKSIFIMSVAIPRQQAGIDGLAINMAKLRARFPKGYNPAAAINRDTKTEDAKSSSLIASVLANK